MVVAVGCEVEAEAVGIMVETNVVGIVVGAIVVESIVGAEVTDTVGVMFVSIVVVGIVVSVVVVGIIVVVAAVAEIGLGAGVAKSVANVVTEHTVRIYDSSVWDRLKAGLGVTRICAADPTQHCKSELFPPKSGLLQRHANLVKARLTSTGKELNL
jgi:hypothetical protein